MHHSKEVGRNSGGLGKSDSIEVAPSHPASAQVYKSLTCSFQLLWSCARNRHQQLCLQGCCLSHFLLLFSPPNSAAQAKEAAFPSALANWLETAPALQLGSRGLKEAVVMRKKLLAADAPPKQLSPHQTGARRAGRSGKGTIWKLVWPRHHSWLSSPNAYPWAQTPVKSSSGAVGQI